MFQNVADLLSQYSFHISAINLIIFFLIIFLTLAARKLALYIFEKKLLLLAARTRTDLDDLILKTFKAPLGYFILAMGAYLAIGSLHLPDRLGIFDVTAIVRSIFVLVFALVLLLLVLNIIDVLGHYLARATMKTETRLDEQMVPLLIKSLKVVVVTLTVLSVMQNLGWNVSSLLAGVGIGGLAMALAAQETVSNLFGSVTVFSDRAFGLGDWIKVGDVEGTVEYVGLRSTRIRRFDQALVTVPNSIFIKSDITNFTRMQKRRINFTLGVSYRTTREQMVQVVQGIKKLIEEDPRFDHDFYMVHFTEFGASSLDVFVYCFTVTTAWDAFLTVREELNLKIMQLLEGLGVEIAFPSRTIYLEEEK
ncbi:MAG: mechanosensitive ion channel family protein [Methanosarcinales archaeon]|nr:mechanosensitive ion channel family protein [Methanosarcinales archaeon]